MWPHGISLSGGDKNRHLLSVFDGHGVHGGPVSKHLRAAVRTAAETNDSTSCSIEGAAAGSGASTLEYDCALGYELEEGAEATRTCYEGGGGGGYGLGEGSVECKEFWDRAPLWLSRAKPTSPASPTSTHTHITAPPPSHHHTNTHHHTNKATGRAKHPPVRRSSALSPPRPKL